MLSLLELCCFVLVPIHIFTVQLHCYILHVCHFLHDCCISAWTMLYCFIIHNVRHICLGNNIWCKALIMWRTVGIISATTTITGFWWIKNRAVLCKLNGGHVRHAIIIFLNEFLLNILICISWYDNLIISDWDKWDFLKFFLQFLSLSLELCCFVLVPIHVLLVQLHCYILFSIFYIVVISLLQQSVSLFHYLRFLAYLLDKQYLV